MNDISKYAKLIKVVKISPQQTDRMRRQYKEWNLSLTRELDREIYDTHHVKPLSLGGSNNRNNLVVMDRKEHAILHARYLDPQVEGLKVGQERYILIPVNYDLKSPEFAMYHKLYVEMMMRYFVRNRPKTREI